MYSNPRMRHDEYVKNVLIISYVTISGTQWRFLRVLRIIRMSYHKYVNDITYNNLIAGMLISNVICTATEAFCG